MRRYFFFSCFDPVFGFFDRFFDDIGYDILVFFFINHVHFMLGWDNATSYKFG